MSISPVTQAKKQLGDMYQRLEKEPLQNLVSCTEKIVQLLKDFPALSGEKVTNKLVDRLFFYCDQLPADKQQQLFTLFSNLHPEMDFDLKLAVQFLNGAQEPRSIQVVQAKISQAFKEYLEQPTVSKEFLDVLKYYKEHISRPLHLRLSGGKFDEEKLSLLADIPIQSLSLIRCPNLKDLKGLDRFAHLKALDLSNNSWVNDSVLAHCKTIEDLTLSGCLSFTKAGLENLKGGALKALTLSYCSQLKDEEMQALADLTLKSLTLKRLEITDHGLASLPKTVELLDLSHSSHIRDSWIDILLQLPLLKKVILNRCPQLTQEKVQLLKSRNIEAVWQPPQPSHLASIAFSKENSS